MIYLPTILDSNKRLCQGIYGVYDNFNDAKRCVFKNSFIDSIGRISDDFCIEMRIKNTDSFEPHKTIFNVIPEKYHGVDMTREMWDKIIDDTFVKV